MVRNTIKVCVRTRPTPDFAQNNIRFDPNTSPQVVQIHQDKGKDGNYINNALEDWAFKCDTILNGASQEATYDAGAKEIVTSVLEGYNGTVLTYGQTGAGKTFTMVGATENYRHRGVIPRALSDIFKAASVASQHNITVRISFLEIYNEMMYDLLASADDTSSENLHIVEDADGNTHVRGLSMKLAANEEEALNYLFEGDMNRTIGQHSLNKASTRSHCIFTVHIEVRSRVESEEKVLNSKLNLVDLAGSERVKKTNSEGKTLDEARSINKTLTFLEQVVMALGEGRSHIPYRQTKLTNVLKDSIGGNCKTLLYANIWPERRYLEETASTLRFAEAMRLVSNAPVVNVQYDMAALCKKYEREIKDLKEELAMHDSLANRAHTSYEPYSEEQRFEILRNVRDYLDGVMEELPIVNLRQIRETFNQFRVVVRNMESAVEERLRSQMVREGASFAAPGTASAGSLSDGGGGHLDADGMAIGEASSSARPLNTDALKHKTLKAKGIKPKEKKVVKEPKKVQPIELPPQEVKSARKPGSESARSGKAPSVVSAKDSAGDSIKGKKAKAPAGKETKDAKPAAKRAVGKKELGKSPSTGNLGSGGEESESDADTDRENGAAAAPVPETFVPLVKPPREVAFEDYKKLGGAATNNALTENKNLLRDKKALAKSQGLVANQAKSEIDQLVLKIEEERKNHSTLASDEGGEAEVIGEEEYAMIMRLKELKARYKSSYETVKTLKGEIDTLERLVTQCRERLIQDFESWFAAAYANVPTEAASNTPAPNLAKEDVLDDGERWDQLQRERVAVEGPGAVAFHNAKVTATRKKSVNRSPGASPKRKQGWT